MEEATSAMERVPLLPSSDTAAKQTAPKAEMNDEPPVIPEITSPVLYPASEVGSSVDDPTPSFLAPFVKRVQGVFQKFCHGLAALFLRLLSTLMLLSGIICSVILQLLAFYYTGVLNSYLLLAVLLYAPTLVAIAIIREEILLNGTSRSGTAPRMSTFVTLAYLALTVSCVASFLLPTIMRGENLISYKSMWLSIAATAFFYYSILVSEVMFAAALNVRREKENDEEQRRREREDPTWMSNYNAVYSALPDSTV